MKEDLDADPSILGMSRLSAHLICEHKQAETSVAILTTEGKMLHTDVLIFTGFSLLIQRYVDTCSAI